MLFRSEASDRVGGRLLTHRFNGEVGYAAERNTPERYDYFDVGAMRFPDTPFMDRVFDLFRNRTDIGQLLVPYTLRDDNNLLYYNLQGPLPLGDYQRLFGDHDKDPDYFRVSVSNRGRVPDRFMDSPPNEWVGKVLDPFRKLFEQINDITDPEERAKAFERAWNELIKYDHYSTRGYMLAPREGKPAGSPEPYPESVVHWLETMSTGTGVYDGSFVETVIVSSLSPLKMFGS